MMHARPALVPLVAALCLSLNACGKNSTAAREKGDDKSTETAAKAKTVTATIASVVETEGQILVELPIGAKDQVEVANLLRVYADKDGQLDPMLLKGMIQVTEVLGQDRCLARQITLTDRANPLAVGDHARTLSDFAGAADNKQFSEQLKNERDKDAKEDAVEDEHFAKLRDHYQRELTAQQQRFDKQLADEKARHDDEVKSISDAHTREIAKIDLEHRTDLTALRTSMTDEANAAVSAERTKQQGKARDITLENTQLIDRIAALGAEQQRLQAQIEKANKDLAEKDRNYREELKAEVESREILQRRIGELEKKRSGSVASTTAVLTNDSNRSETVLEKLNRISGELEANKTRNAELEKRSSEAEASVDQLSKQVKENRHAVEQLAENEKVLAAAKEQLAAAELAKLEAERALYDLSARVLRLKGNNPDLAELQNRLRKYLALNPEVNGAKEGVEEKSP